MRVDRLQGSEKISIVAITPQEAAVVLQQLESTDELGPTGAALKASLQAIKSELPRL